MSIIKKIKTVIVPAIIGTLNYIQGFFNTWWSHLGALGWLFLFYYISKFYTEKEQILQLESKISNLEDKNKEEKPKFIPIIANKSNEESSKELQK